MMHLALWLASKVLQLEVTELELQVQVTASGLSKYLSRDSPASTWRALRVSAFKLIAFHDEARQSPSHRVCMPRLLVCCCMKTMCGFHLEMR
jgi:hypothetical protein